LAALGEAFGQRPSQILEWNDPDDMVERYLFDLLCLSLKRQREEEELKSLERRLR